MALDILLDLVGGNKWLLAAFATIAAAGVVYVKGRAAGARAVQEQNETNRKRIEQIIRESEAKNQKIDREREKDANAVNGVNTIDGLIRMWDEVTRKDTDPKA
jgi:hypothetical protein